MNQLGTLYHFELKKLTQRKLLWITFSICILTISIFFLTQLTGSYYVDGELVDTHYHMFQVDSAYRRALSGREVGQELIEETIWAYRQIPADEPRYTLTDEYQTYARPYSEIFHLIRRWIGLDELSEIASWTPDEEALYQARSRTLEAFWQNEPLSDAEKAYWREKEARLEKPFSYYYMEGYVTLLEAYLTVGVLVLLFVGICLSSVFSEEHTRRTDQLMLSSARGKSTVYWAKIWAGSTVSATCTTLMTLLTFLLAFCIYGAEGFEAPVQIFMYTYSYPLTMGQACLIAYGILIITSVLMSVFAMVLSEVLHSNIGTLAVVTGLIIAGNVVLIPDEYRVIAQLWDCMPMTFLAMWNVFSSRLINVFGICFTRWQLVPVIYVVCGGGIAVVGKRVFQGYQVSGR